MYEGEKRYARRVELRGAQLDGQRSALAVGILLAYCADACSSYKEAKMIEYETHIAPQHDKSTTLATTLGRPLV
ncbi:MAG TPA: hypothetical protein VNT02_02460 [Burkholderiales bacterium]|nr:hypothetical protein [Burkholderiales bacterium]